MAQQREASIRTGPCVVIPVDRDTTIKLQQNGEIARASLILPECRVQKVPQTNSNVPRRNNHITTPANAVQNYLTVPIQLDHSTRTVLIQIQGVKRTFILDSGSCRSILQPGVSDEPTGCTKKLGLSASKKRQTS
jgi:hypothetical protein